MSKNIKVLVNASCDIQYSSYYIWGLWESFGKKKVKFTSKLFPKFKHNNHFFAFIILDGDTSKKVIIDFTDSSVIDNQALSWCDVYGKINLDFDNVHDGKIVAIGPSFGIRIFSYTSTLLYAFINMLKAYRYIPNKRKFLSDYKSQYLRPRLMDYKLNQENSNYIFFMASLWKKETKTNNFRANFIKSCRRNDSINFEGGFAPRTKNDIIGFEDITTSKRVDMKLYMNNIIKSCLVFNTPAVKNCHGWKLAEFMCLGKTIISTKLSRKLPENIEDGTHLLLCDGSQLDIDKKINSILKNSNFKDRLEKNSKEYFDSYLAPKQVILRLLNL